MTCPRCSTGLRQGKARGSRLELDQCPSCKGLWFDDGELGALLGPVASGGVSVPPHAKPSQGMQCPRCSTALAWFCYPGTVTVIDACRSCQGVWLDAGEVKALQASLGERPARMSCPRCQAAQPTAESCAHCGIVIAKYRPEGIAAAVPLPPRAAPDSGPRGVKGALLRFIEQSIASLLS